MIRTVSIWRWQLVFTGSIVAIVVMITAFTPQTLTIPLFIAGLALVVFTTLLTLAVPWRRLPRTAVVTLPLLDALAVGLTTSAPDLRLGLLWVFPVTWLATYFSMPWVLGGVAFISACLVAFAEHTGEPAEVLLRVLTVIITLSFLGVTVRVGSQRSRAARRLLERRSDQVNRAAERAQTNQQRVTQIIDALGVALVVVAGDGRILQMNDAYRALYGRDRFGAAVPSAAVEYDQRRGAAVPPDLTTLARAAAGEKLDDERVWLFDSNGQWRALQVSTQTMASEDEHIALVIIDDVTTVLDAAEERRTLAAIVSHELRNPLTAIIGHVDLLLERDDLPTRVTAQLEVIANAGERMEDLVASTLESTKHVPDEPFEPVDLRQVVEASAASFAPLISSSRKELEVSGAESMVIYGDAFRLRQVIDNLLSNAVKYTPAEGRITAELGSAPDGQAELSIRDTGTGIAADELPRLFEPYFRTERAVLAGVAGTGLGMGIARDIVEAHEGSISVDSTLGAGTIVTLRFPQRRVKEVLA
ncbi:cell wall metabolism sensor histidine kinase WalK [Microbacterium sp. W4I20]|uniref:sensor histidine kinase n=1 Tax=Microbacterium sp. W4I20 TaxID=3042262 RepID=UPI002782FB48|nr:PAS domain-containing sensor histidine kinase [Microbacterium sp. W4I20]MDQ0726286.1 two-component system phosphate regulon sensor histidine kinase PhoR [Microbacterium sp. W4I20]